MPKQTRHTRQKNILAEALAQYTTFFTGEDLYKTIHKKHPDIGIATVYRFLKELRKKGKLYTYTCDRRMLYAKENKSHCHFTCQKTGTITHFEIENIDFLKHIKHKIPGKIQSFQLEIQGVCHECA